MKIIKKIIPVLFFLSLSFVTLVSCKRNGTGGKAEIHALIYRGSTPIVGTTTLYVKFNAKSEPSDPTGSYDLKVNGEPDDNHVHVENMRPGNYYLYAVAYDSLAKAQVKGGTAVTLKWSERKKEKDVEVQTN